MATIVDSINVVNSLEEAPDRLRAEIGRYYSPENRGPNNTSFAFFRTGIKKDFIKNLEFDNDQLIPTTRAQIFVSGREEQFRDQAQWEEYIKKTIVTNKANLDHQFSFVSPVIEGIMVKNYHHPDYEDLTKTYGTNQLLNYNLISYPHKDEVPMVQKIGDLKTNFDNEDYIVNSHFDIDELITEFPNRIANYSGSIEEVDLKQRNIFDLDAGGHFISKGLDRFPFYYKKVLQFPSSTNSLTEAMHRHRKSKNIFQSLKQDLAFSNREFQMGTRPITGKIHNLLDICLSSRIISTVEQSNELFLLGGDEIDTGLPWRRFLEQYNAVRFLSDMRQLLINKSRNIEQVYDSQPSESFIIGYKIEKYLDNTAGLPIQTYYTTNKRFYDTQLKYGREYIYKTKILIGVLGSSYEYSNLFISKNETEMVSETGVTAEFSPSGLGDIMNDKYRAYVNVELTPSFQILEMEVDQSSQVFIDVPPPRPQVEFHNDSKKDAVDFFFSPMLFVNKEFLFDGESLGMEEDLYDILTDEEEVLNYLLSLSDAPSKPFDYFTGIYEVYRMDRPPESKGDFINNLVATIDDKTAMAYPSNMQLPSFALDNMNGHYRDKILPNKKYYYLFRSISYHGTPSNLTGPYCVEMLQDSDEFKVSVEEYRYPETSVTPRQKPVKRLMRLMPNLERLSMSEVEQTNQGLTSYRVDSGNMLNKGYPQKIKLRVTSKHTGKKMDININLVLKEDTNSFN